MSKSALAVAHQLSEVPPNPDGNDGRCVQDLAGIFVNSAVFRDLQPRILVEMLKDPRCVQFLMKNTQLQAHFSNPERMQALVAENPQLQELLKGNQDIIQLVTNQAVLRDTVKMLQNPPTLTEFQDRSLRRIE